MNQDLPEGWKLIPTHEMNSTISNPVIGWESKGGVSVTVWAGIENEDGVAITPHIKEGVPEEAKYIIEVKYLGDLVDELFAETEQEAINRAQQRVVVESERELGVDPREYARLKEHIFSENGDFSVFFGGGYVGFEYGDCRTTAVGYSEQDGQGVPDDDRVEALRKLSKLFDVMAEEEQI